MVTMETSTLEEHAAVRHSFGFLELSYRGKIKITGPDRVTFLHSLISNDVEGLPEFSGRYGTLLTPTGKIVSDFYYYRFPEFLLVDIEPALLPKTMETLENYIIMDEVYLKDISDDVAHFSVQGPRSPELLEKLFGLPGPLAQYRVQETKWEGEWTWIIGKNELARVGCEIMLSELRAATLRRAILGSGDERDIRQVNAEVRNILRVEAGIPWYGVDMDESTYPMEARLDGAISLTKGCYVGQEVVARATNLGGVPKLLMGLKLRGDSIPPRGARVLESEGKQIGAVTSGVFSPQLGTAIAFAYLKRNFAVPGSVCDVEISEQKFVSCEVVDRFL